MYNFNKPQIGIHLCTIWQKTVVLLMLFCCLSTNLYAQDLNNLGLPENFDVKIGFTRPNCKTVENQRVLFAHDFMIDNKYWTIYYTQAKFNNKPNWVANIFLVPEDYKQVKDKFIEITSPPKVEKFILHITKENQFWGLYVFNIYFKDDKKKYRDEFEIVIPEHIGDKIFFLLTDETSFQPNPKFKTSVHKKYDAALKPRKSICLTSDLDREVDLEELLPSSK